MSPRRYSNVEDFMNDSSRTSAAAHTQLRRLFALAAVLVLGLFGTTAAAGPEAHILRIDPRTGQDTGNPVITTVIELIQAKRISEATSGCANDKGNALYDCKSRALEK